MMARGASSLAFARRDPASAAAIIRTPPTEPVELGILSGREKMVALLVSAGLSNKEIGQRLQISHWTVSTHLKRVFIKLGITRRIELCILVSASRD